MTSLVRIREAGRVWGRGGGGGGGVHMMLSMWTLTLQETCMHLGSRVTSHTFNVFDLHPQDLYVQF